MIDSKSNYQPSTVFKNKHFNTIYRNLFQEIEVNYSRKRIELPDGDFLDLDFSTTKSTKLILAVHGLEGSSNSIYIKSLTNFLNNNNYTVIALNLKGCSGEPNRLLSSYHSGKTDDIHFVINYLSKNYTYSEINLVGYSLGGNIVIKYLGEMKNKLPSLLKSAVTISVPCDLHGSSIELSKFWNKMYMQRFLISLKEKLRIKSHDFPQSFLDLKKINDATNFYDIDNLYTAPAHGFKNAIDYWNKSSSKQFIEGIKLPTLLITSSDDPFLSKSCIPIKEAKSNPFFFLENTKYGGHVGYNLSFSKVKNNWLESRILNFLSR